jgi:hypothetical protein
MGQNQELIEKGSSGYFQPMNNDSKTQKTKFQVMAEIQASTALVQSAFNQAYAYQEAEYREIFRRFCRRDSKDIDVIEFQSECLRKGVPEKLLIPDLWELSPSRVMGSGNKTLEMAISDQLLQMRPMFDPEPQREILRDVVFGVTDDAARAERLVPEQPLKVSDSVHDAQLCFTRLMSGLPVAIKTGMNHVEYIGSMLQDLGAVIQECNQQGGMAKPEQIKGMNLVAQHIQEHLKILSQDKNEKAIVAAFGKQLGKLMNFVKAFQQRLEQAMKKQQQQQQQGGQNGDAQKDAAKAQAMLIQAKTKAELGKQSHAQKTAQRQLSWEMEEQRKAREFEMEQQREHLGTVAEVEREHAKTMDEIQRNRAVSESQPEGGE